MLKWKSDHPAVQHALRILIIIDSVEKFMKFTVLTFALVAKESESIANIIRLARQSINSAVKLWGFIAKAIKFATELFGFAPKSVSPFKNFAFLGVFAGLLAQIS